MHESSSQFDPLTFHTKRVFGIAIDRQARKWLILVVLLIVTTALFSSLTPLALRAVIEAISDDDAGAGVRVMLLWVAIYTAGLFVTRVLLELRQFVQSVFEQRVKHRLSEHLFVRLLRLPIGVHVQRRLGETMDIVESGIAGCQLLLNQCLSTMIPVVIELVFIGSLLFHLGRSEYLWPLLGAGAIFTASYRWAATRLHLASLQVAQSQSARQSFCTEALYALETVKYLNGEVAMERRHQQFLRSLRSAWRRYFEKLRLIGLLQASIAGACLGATFVMAVLDAVAGRISAGDFVLLHTFALRLMQPLESIGGAMRRSAQSLVQVHRLSALLQERTEALSPCPIKLPGLRLEFAKVCFSYKGQADGLQDLSFTLEAGKVIGVVGLSGSGKSSVLRLMARFYEPSAGCILLDGVAIDELPIACVRRCMAVVPQEVILLHESIADNIAFGDVATATEIECAGRRAGLAPLVAELPLGYGTLVGERGLTLSGGERQRLAVARALLRRAPICVLDEATSSLDSVTEAMIMAGLLATRGEQALLLISHRLVNLVTADEILLLERGRIVERGTHRELLKRGRRYSELWQSQHGSAMLQ